MPLDYNQQTIYIDVLKEDFDAVIPGDYEHTSICNAVRRLNNTGQLPGENGVPEPGCIFQSSITSLGYDNTSIVAVGRIVFCRETFDMDNMSALYTAIESGVIGTVGVALPAQQPYLATLKKIR